ncbi:hypothetical protein O988_05178 [Pseudogymnoascus sp. VKM F-3808]|nr:hypothetical protein O988_05178 [Pseudogymnoascus sp. VKM F-3808]
MGTKREEALALAVIMNGGYAIVTLAALAFLKILIRYGPDNHAYQGYIFGGTASKKKLNNTNPTLSPENTKQLHQQGSFVRNSLFSLDYICGLPINRNQIAPCAYVLILKYLSLLPLSWRLCTAFAATTYTTLYMGWAPIPVAITLLQ